MLLNYISRLPDSMSLLKLVFGVFLVCFIAGGTGIHAADSKEFDHYSTGFPLTGVHSSAACGSCHIGGIFKGLKSQCSFCHTPAGRVAATPKPSLHISSSNNCDSCHTDSTWSQVTRVDHGEINGSCSSCHNSTTATGKSPNHVTSSNTCETCHITTKWTSARFDHNNVSSNCVSCHNGSTATGKSPRHIRTTSTCVNCHRTSSWNPFKVDHGDIQGTCTSCHNGSVARGNQPTTSPALIPVILVIPLMDGHQQHLITPM